MSFPNKDGRKTIRVVIAEDQGMVLGALATLLEIEGDISVVGRARDGQEALECVLTQKPDVFLTDIEMPRLTGLDVAAELKRQRVATRVVIVTKGPDREVPAEVQSRATGRKDGCRRPARRSWREMVW